MPDTSKAAYQRWLAGIKPQFFMSYFEWVQSILDAWREECAEELQDA